MLHERLAWRRQSTGGPIDDRWSSLALHKDEATGAIYVYEVRKECPPTSSLSQRTCYRKELRFPPEATPEGGSLLLNHYESPVGPGAWVRDDYTEERLARDVHVGDRGSHETLFTWNNTLVPLRRARQRPAPRKRHGTASENPHPPSGPGRRGIRRSFCRRRPWPWPVGVPLAAGAGSSRGQSAAGQALWAAESRSADAAGGVDGRREVLVYRRLGALKGDVGAVILVSFDSLLHNHERRH